MEEALRLAREAAARDEVPVGAVVIQSDVQGGAKIVGRGYNLRETEHNPLAHAEVQAILEASRAIGSWRLIGCTLVVTLEPCPMCLAACQQARVEKVIYGATDPKGGALSLGYRLHEDARTNHRFSVELQETAECSQVLKDFFRAKRG